MASADHDIIVIGGGTAGLVTAAGSAALGARVALVERERLGGDCLWTGCVPSKALIAAARTRHLTGQGGWAEAGAWIQGAQARVAKHDDAHRFRAMGVEVVFSPARLAGPGRVEVRDRVLRAKRIVLATGALPAAPSIAGLEETGYWTYLTAFDQATLPRTIAIIGGGAIGIEFAQSYARLGVKVTVVERLPEVLPAEDPEVGRFIRQQLQAEGIAVRAGFTATLVTREGRAKVMPLATAAKAVEQKTVALKIEGMTCGGCAIATRKALARLPGVSHVEVSYEKKRAIVTYDPARVTVEQMIAAARTLGYTATALLEEA